MEQQLDNLFFHDCSCPKVIYANFAKRLVSAIAKREAQHQNNEHDQTYIFQQCEWHRIQRIKCYLVAAKKYLKEVRVKIIDLIWKWVKSSTLLELEANDTKLLQALLPAEQKYLLLNYQTKKHQFICIYT